MHSSLVACSNRRKDGKETDTDCGGGVCAACMLGLKCSRGSDCASQYCVMPTSTFDRCFCRVAHKRDLTVWCARHYGTSHRGSAKAAMKKASSGRKEASCDAITMVQCEHVRLRGPKCDACFKTKAGHCSVEKVDAFCYGHSDDVRRNVSTM